MVRQTQEKNTRRAPVEAGKMLGGEIVRYSKWPILRGKEGALWHREGGAKKRHRGSGAKR